MPVSISEIKDRLVRIVNEDGTVRDMASAADAISILEKMTVTKEELESTRLGLLVNNIRRASKNSPLAKRAKNLIISWKKLISSATPARLVQRTRPETPNSVGSSPSPPEYNIVRNFSSPQLTSKPHSRSITPTTDPGAKRLKKHKTSPENVKSNRRKDVVINKGQSSEVKSEKQALDTGQPTVSLGSNGLKLTFKTQPTSQASTGLNKSAAIKERSKVHSLKPSPSDSSLSAPHKTHKKKKGHKSPFKTSSSALPVANERTPSEEDVYNNNNTEHKIHGSKSAPALTVTSSGKDLTKTSSARTETLARTSSPNQVTPNLKRKWERTQVDTASPEGTPENRPRAPKERRLTYDPLTGQLKQVPSQDKPNSVSSEVSRRTMEKPSSTKSTFSATKTVKEPRKLADSKNGPISGSEQHLYNKKTFGKAAVKVANNVEERAVVSSKIETLGTDDSGDIEWKGMPTRLSPIVEILGDSSSSLRKSCSKNCSSSDLHETHREFRKRKTRRKDAGLFDLRALFPISSAIDAISSDSDENYDSENSFAASVHVPDSEELTHSQNCVWPGVTGCRGNNGAWYDWKETFCVKNHENSERLPLEEEIMPLQILPYVELD